MAGETIVEVPDDSIVEIDLPENFDGGDDKSKTANGAAAPAPAEAKVSVTSGVDEAAAALQRSLDEERQKRIAAEQQAGVERQRADTAGRLAQQREQEVQEARAGSAASQMRETLSNLEASKREMQSAKAAYKAAHESGDSDKLADAVEQMNLLGGRISLMEARKGDLEQTAIRQERVVAEPVITAPPTDPVEAYLANPNFSLKARAWLRSHPDCLPAMVGGSAEKNAAMMRGHHIALGQGVPGDSEDYYRLIEEQTGYRAPVSVAARTTAAGEGEPKPTPRRQPMPSAAPTNEPPSPSGQPTVTRRTFKLDRDMQEHALISFPQNNGEDERVWKKRAFGQYAYNLAELTREGKMGRTTH